MRWLICVSVAMLAGCDSAIRQVGPGNPRPGTGGSGSGFGDDDDESGAKSCDERTSEGTCKEYIGRGWDDAAMSADCSTVVSEAGCPPSDIGGCDQTLNNPQGVLLWYYTGAFYTASSAAQLQAQCEQAYYTWYSP